MVLEEIKKIEPKTQENNVIKLETPKDEPEIFDQKEEKETEDQPLILTNEISDVQKKDDKKIDQTLSPAVRKIVNEKKIEIVKR